MNPSIEQIRKDYQLGTLSEADVFEDPIRQFQQWLQQAIHSQLPEPTVMTLATATKDGTPSARIVLLKGADDRGFTFYTNMQSHKGDNIRENPRVSLVFCWLELERQVRIEGMAYPLSDKEATAYFQQRPKGSQISASVSPQSRVVPNRQWLEAAYAALEQQYADQTALPKPDFWGGYLVQPYKIEFWQGRQDRLHDRILYTLAELSPTKKWRIERLAP